MKNDLVVTLKVGELENIINRSIEGALSKVPEAKPEETLMRRKEVAKFFSVSLVTVSEWMKAGKLPYHRINSRVFFKRSEILEAMGTNEKYKRHK